MNLSKYDLDNIFKLDYKKILSLFKETKDLNQNIPNLKIEEDGYTFEIITKSDIRGFTAGYPYSCQYIGGEGEKFVHYGTKK